MIIDFVFKFYDFVTVVQHHPIEEVPVPQLAANGMYDVLCSLINMSNFNHSFIIMTRI